MKLRSTAAAVAIAATATMGLAACGGEEAPKAKDAWNASQESAGKYKHGGQGLGQEQRQAGELHDQG